MEKLVDIKIHPFVEEMVLSRSAEMFEEGNNGDHFTEDVLETTDRIMKSPQIDAPYTVEPVPRWKIVSKRFGSTIIYEIDLSTRIGHVVDIYLRGENLPDGVAS